MQRSSLALSLSMAARISASDPFESGGFRLGEDVLCASHLEPEDARPITFAMVEVAGTAKETIRIVLRYIVVDF